MVKTEKSCAKKLLAGMKILLIVFGQNSLYSDSWARHNEKMKKQLAVPPPRSKGACEPYKHVICATRRMEFKALAADRGLCLEK